MTPQADELIHLATRHGGRDYVVRREGNRLFIEHIDSGDVRRYELRTPPIWPHMLAAVAFFVLGFLTCLAGVS